MNETLAALVNERVASTLGNELIARIAAQTNGELLTQRVADLEAEVADLKKRLASCENARLEEGEK